MGISENQIAVIQDICKKHKVKFLYAFGSVLTDSYNNESDIDLLVEIDLNNPYAYTDAYFELKEELEKLLNRKIDLLENRGLKNKFLIEEINSTKVAIYGQED